MDDFTDLRVELEPSIEQDSYVLKQDALLRSAICFIQVDDERKNIIVDGGTAIFDQDIKESISLLSDWGNEVFKKATEQSLRDSVLLKEKADSIEKYLETKDLLRLTLTDSQINQEEDTNIPLDTVFKHHDGFVQEENALNTVESYEKTVLNNTFYIKLPIEMFLGEDSVEDELFSISISFGQSDYITLKQPILLPYLSKSLESFKKYRIYAFAYPKLPIPCEIEVNVLFYSKDNSCKTGFLNRLKLQFEDYFLPIYYPNISAEGKKELKFKLFAKFWKSFKRDEKAVNAYKLFETPWEKMVEIVRGRFGPFLLDHGFEDKLFQIKNPYTKEAENTGLAVKDIYSKSRVSGNYDFTFDKLVRSSRGKADGQYCQAKVLIFLAGNFHLLFKIKISRCSTMVLARSDCFRIIEFLDEFYSTWI